MALVDVLLNELLSNVHLIYLLVGLKYFAMFKISESMLFFIHISLLCVPYL